MSLKVQQDFDFQNIARIRNLMAPVNSDEPARLADLNAAVEGLAWKDNCRIASTANINLAAPGATLDGITMVSGDRFLAKNQTSTPENGIYVWNGAATPATRALDASTGDELESAVTTIDEGTNGGSTFRQTLVNFTIGSGSPAFTSFGTSAPAASETVSGVAELATQAETDSGTDDLRIVTPLKLAGYAGRKRTNTTNVGDGSATQYDITHNFGTRSTVVSVFRNSSPWDNILCDIERPDANTTRVRFAAAPTSNQFTVTTIA